MATPGILKKRYGDNLPKRLQELVSEFKVVWKMAAEEGVAPHAIRHNLLAHGYRAERNKQGEWIWYKPDPEQPIVVN
jgi:hypothetical protein